MIIMKTEMGYGVDYMMGSHKWHGVAPNDEQLAIGLAQNDETLLQVVPDGNWTLWRCLPTQLFQVGHLGHGVDLV